MFSRAVIPVVQKMSTPNIYIALLEPEIPPNTGNIARLCAANEVPLHLIGRLGFHLDDRSVKRAGLDYWDAVDLHLHTTLAEFEDFLGKEEPSGRMVCFSAHAKQRYTDLTYRSGDCLLFGSETRGLPASILERYQVTAVTIPMLTKNVRSLNLATAAGIGLYEALRQLHEW